MKTSKLIVEYDYDFEVLAIISSVKDYKLAWAINKSLNISLCKTNDVCFDFIKSGRLLISSFIFETEYTTFSLLRNKSYEFTKIAKPYLLPELKEYDYIIKISGVHTFLNAESTLERLKKLNIVEYIKQIDINTLKSKENLIF
jgi:hypothetical protein